MSAANIITALEKLIKLHKSLNNLAQRKTAIIKEGDMDALSQLLMDEQKHIKAIELTENEREKHVQEFLLLKGAGHAPSTITSVMELASHPEQEQLNILKQALLNEAQHLKDQNALNQQLIFQSLQFVNLSLEMLLPQKDSYNYEKPVHTPSEQGFRNSLFDSKA